MYSVTRSSIRRVCTVVLPLVAQSSRDHTIHTRTHSLTKTTEEDLDRQAVKQTEKRRRLYRQRSTRTCNNEGIEATCKAADTPAGITI